MSSAMKPSSAPDERAERGLTTPPPRTTNSAGHVVPKPSLVAINHGHQGQGPVFPHAITPRFLPLILLQNVERG